MIDYVSIVNLGGYERFPQIKALKNIFTSVSPQKSVQMLLIVYRGQYA